MVDQLLPLLPQDMSVVVYKCIIDFMRSVKGEPKFRRNRDFLHLSPTRVGIQSDNEKSDNDISDSDSVYGTHNNQHDVTRKYYSEGTFSASTQVTI